MGEKFFFFFVLSAVKGPVVCCDPEQTLTKPACRCVHSHLSAAHTHTHTAAVFSRWSPSSCIDDALRFWFLTNDTRHLNRWLPVCAPQNLKDELWQQHSTRRHVFSFHVPFPLYWRQQTHCERALIIRNTTNLHNKCLKNNQTFVTYSCTDIVSKHFFYYFVP